MESSKAKNPHRNSKASKDASRQFNITMVDTITDILKENGMTSKQLGAELGINQSTFGKYFSYDSKIPCDVLRAIAIELGVSADHLLGITRSKHNTPIYFDMINSVNFSDTAIDAITSFGPEKFLVLDNLLETGIQNDILDIFKSYKEAVLSNFVAYASTDWYRALAESIQSGIEELRDITVHPDSVSEMNRYLGIVEDIPDGEKHDLAYASYILFLRGRTSRDFYEHRIKKLRYEACFQFLELLSEYGASYLRHCSSRTLKDNLEHNLLELLHYNTHLAERIQDSVDRPPVDKLREDFYPSL